MSVFCLQTVKNYEILLREYISVTDIKHPTLDQNCVDQHCHCFWYPRVVFLLNLFLMLQHLRPRDFNLPRCECLGMSIGSSMFMSVTKTRKEEALVNILPNNSFVICSFWLSLSVYDT